MKFWRKSENYGFQVEKNRIIGLIGVKKFIMSFFSNWIKSIYIFAMITTLVLLTWLATTTIIQTHSSTQQSSHEKILPNPALITSHNKYDSISSTEHLKPPSNFRHDEKTKIQQTPGNDRLFFPHYKFPFWGLPYGIHNKGGFFNPGMFPFVPGGPAFPPYDGIFGGPEGPGKFPGSGPNPFQGSVNDTIMDFNYAYVDYESLGNGDMMDYDFEETDHFAPQNENLEYSESDAKSRRGRMPRYRSFRSACNCQRPPKCKCRRRRIRTTTPAPYEYYKESYPEEQYHEPENYPKYMKPKYKPTMPPSRPKKNQYRNNYEPDQVYEKPYKYRRRPRPRTTTESPVHEDYHRGRYYEEPELYEQQEYMAYSQGPYIPEYHRSPPPPPPYYPHYPQTQYMQVPLETTTTKPQQTETTTATPPCYAYSANILVPVPCPNNAQLTTTEYTTTTTPTPTTTIATTTTPASTTTTSTPTVATAPSYNHMIFDAYRAPVVEREKIHYTQPIIILPVQQQLPSIYGETVQKTYHDFTPIQNPNEYIVQSQYQAPDIYTTYTTRTPRILPQQNQVHTSFSQSNGEQQQWQENGNIYQERSLMNLGQKNQYDNYGDNNRHEFNKPQMTNPHSNQIYFNSVYANSNTNSNSQPVGYPQLQDYRNKHLNRNTMNSGQQYTHDQQSENNYQNDLKTGRLINSNHQNPNYLNSGFSNLPADSHQQWYDHNYQGRSMEENNNHWSSNPIVMNHPSSFSFLPTSYEKEYESMVTSPSSRISSATIHSSMTRRSVDQQQNGTKHSTHYNGGTHLSGPMHIYLGSNAQIYLANAMHIISKANQSAGNTDTKDLTQPNDASASPMSESQQTKETPETTTPSVMQSPNESPSSTMIGVNANMTRTQRSSDLALESTINNDSITSPPVTPDETFQHQIKSLPALLETQSESNGEGSGKQATSTNTSTVDNLIAEESIQVEKFISIIKPRTQNAHQYNLKSK